jgi:glycosyltransferase involved in cell wall biosynthesis
MCVSSPFCLNSEYSTTRMVAKEQSRIENDPSSKLQTQLFFPANSSRQGGLRTKGYFKKTFNDKPLVSVITVVFNGHKYLEQTIQSVINQTYDNVEYIIIDGGSTDGTVDIIRKYEHAIDYWISEPDKGVYDAVNKGLMLALGDSIGIIHSNDWYEADAIEKIVFIAGGPIDCVVHGNMNLYKNNEMFYEARFCGAINKIKKGMVINHPTAFIGRSLYKKYGLFDTKYIIASDWDLVLRFWKAEVPFVFIPRLIANFRIGGISYDINSSTILEKHYIRKSNLAYKVIDFYWLFDMIKIAVFGKYVSPISIIRQKLRSK